MENDDIGREGWRLLGGHRVWVTRPGGNYPMGCNLAFYVAPNNLMVEMETFGEEQTVLPGQTITNREVWTILEEVQDWQSIKRFMDLEETLRAVC